MKDTHQGSPPVKGREKKKDWTKEDADAGRWPNNTEVLVGVLPPELLTWDWNDF